ncbi:DUF6765 family protein [Cupriavidus necator]
MASALLLGAGVVVSQDVNAYEADVHYGLVKWLALKADFTEWQAEAIAIGNTRVDSGTPTTQEIVLDYGCFEHDARAAQAIQSRHYPSPRHVPASPADRLVEPGGPAARALLKDTVTRANGKEAQFLSLFGAALHPLQDSWSHGGEPSIPAGGVYLHCDPTLASGPPNRGKGGAHSANATYVAPDDALAMAEATYAELQRFPLVQGRVRHAARWSDLVAGVNRFAVARTKTEKRRWFLAQSFASTDFLAGITLPDGPDAGPAGSIDNAMPPLSELASQQHNAPQGTRAFFDLLFTRWLSNEPAETIVAQLGVAEDSSGHTNSGTRRSGSKRAELSALMKLWKMRDHGAVEHLAHSSRPLSAGQMNEIQLLTARKTSFVNPKSPADALVALVLKGENPSQLLPYIVRDASDAASSRPRVVAIMRLKHAPYDTIGWIAERFGSDWRLVYIVATVDQ